MRTWLILDCNYLCYRSYHAMGQLSFGDALTGVIFGFLRDIPIFEEVHTTDLIAFCFDYGRSIRCEIYPRYKANRRKELTDEQETSLRSMQKQMRLLRTKYLHRIGFRNVFLQKGYEADDLIASVVDNLPKGHHAVIVGSDHDLFQLISPRVSLWNPHQKKMYDIAWFRREFRLEPAQWVEVKALAGCTSDNVQGITGVGEKTAIKYLKGKLKPGTIAYERIVSNSALIKLNTRLVELPYKGTMKCKLRRDEVSKEGWSYVTTRLGMHSLTQTPLLSTR